MHSRWYTIAVVLLWLASMSWLLATKVIPPMLTGEPPSYRTILETKPDPPPVGWKMSLGREQIGWALSMVIRQSNETSEIHSLVHFDRVPLEEIIPAGYRAGVRAFLPTFDLPSAKLEVETESLVLVDPLGHFAGFDSVLRIKPLQEVLKMGGMLKGNQLELTVQAGTESFTKLIDLPEDPMLGDDFSPQSRLTPLRLGQKWWVPSYSFSRLNDPFERMQATVEDSIPLVWNNETVKAWLVVYRGDPTLGLTGDRNIRGRLWVHPDPNDGRVLKQEVRIGGRDLIFERMSDEKSAAMESQLRKEGKQPRLAPR